MTDLEKFVALYASFGIPLEVERSSDGTQSVEFRAKVTPKTGGYTHFYMDVSFDENGKFLGQDIGE